ncbi:MAG: hypothetical protein CSB46_11775 [Micrococcales bacterium]|nr:MAG: hypothetical protein CSB46_11775 [Micrococcales bacterium]
MRGRAGRGLCRDGPVSSGRHCRPTLAVVGASGLVGSVTVSLLSVRPFHWGEVRLLGSERSAGRSVPVRGRRQPVLAIDDNAFDGIDIAIFASPADAAEKWIPGRVRVERARSGHPGGCAIAQWRHRFRRGARPGQRAGWDDQHAQ